MRVVILISCGVVLASCSRLTGSSSLPAGMPNDSAHPIGAVASELAHPLTGTGYKSLYSFKGRKDGAFPEAGLIAANGTLYGTTMGGGGCTGFTYGCGTVFALQTSGTETVLHRFKGGKDGEWPQRQAEKVRRRLLHEKDAESRSRRNFNR